MANCQVPIKEQTVNSTCMCIVCTPIDLYVNVNKMLISIFCRIRFFDTGEISQVSVLVTVFPSFF